MNRREAIAAAFSSVAAAAAVPRSDVAANVEQVVPKQNPHVPRPVGDANNGKRYGVTTVITTQTLECWR